MIKNPDSHQSPILSIGHSTHSLEDFVHLLLVHRVELLVDIRTVPRSRRNPQFNRETFPDALHANGVDYMHLQGLGGFRHSGLDPSPNMGWRNASFRNYADYMLEPAFEEELLNLIDLSHRHRTALMCAEALPWRCHRSLISDALTVRGIRVEHIMSASSTQPHRLTPWARVEGTRITYPSFEERSASGGF